MYCFCIDNKFNIISIPKNGCTQIIKYISQYLNIFDLHEHSFTTNNCNKYNNIHTCGSRMYSYNSTLPTYLITRPIELKVLSYFKANYYYHKKINDNPTFEYFVNNLHTYYNNDIHHLGMIENQLKGIKIDYLLDLKDIEIALNNLFNQHNINFTFVKQNIINNSSDEYSENENDLSNVFYKDLKFPVKNKLFLDEQLVEKIKLFYKNDLQYYTNNSM